MIKFKHWVRKQDFIELIKKINYVAIPLFVIFILITVWAINNISVLPIVGIFLVYIIILAVLYGVPLIIHQKKN